MSLQLLITWWRKKSERCPWSEDIPVCLCSSFLHWHGSLGSPLDFLPLFALSLSFTNSIHGLVLNFFFSIQLEISSGSIIALHSTWWRMVFTVSLIGLTVTSLFSTFFKLIFQCNWFRTGLVSTWSNCWGHCLSWLDVNQRLFPLSSGLSSHSRSHSWHLCVFGANF